jgi:hypothetical protein
MVNPAVVRRGRRARVQRFEIDQPPARRRISTSAPATAPARYPRPRTMRTRAVVALGAALAIIGVGTAVGLRATIASGHEAPHEAPRTAPAPGAAALIQR